MDLLGVLQTLVWQIVAKPYSAFMAEAKSTAFFKCLITLLQYVWLIIACSLFEFEDAVIRIEKPKACYALPQEARVGNHNDDLFRSIVESSQSMLTAREQGLLVVSIS